MQPCPIGRRTHTGLVELEQHQHGLWAEIESRAAVALRLEQPTHQPAFSYGSSMGSGAKDVTERCAGKILLPSHCSSREENHITSLLCRVQESCGEVYHSARAVGYVPALCTHWDAFLPPAFVNRGAKTEVRSPVPEPHSVSGPSPFKVKSFEVPVVTPSDPSYSLS